MPTELDSPRSLWVLGHHVTLIPCGGRARVFDATSPVGVPGPPPHRHEDSDEFFYVLEGRLGVNQEGDWTSLGPGDYLNVPRGTTHTFRNDGSEDARFISGYEPSGFEQFFLDIGFDAADEGSREASVSDELMPRVGESLVRHGAVLA